MPPRDLQKTVLSSDMLPSEKLVGLIVAFHINGKTGRTRLRQQTIADEAGLSVPSVKRAVKTLADARLISRTTTGRSSVFSINSPGTNTGNVGGSPMIPQMDHQDTLSRPSKYALDTEFSTPAEERNKRDQAAFDREQSSIFTEEIYG